MMVIAVGQGASLLLLTLLFVLFISLLFFAFLHLRISLSSMIVAHAPNM